MIFWIKLNQIKYFKWINFKNFLIFCFNLKNFLEFQENNNNKTGSQKIYVKSRELYI